MVDDEGVRILGFGIRYSVFLDLAGLDVELADEAAEVAGKPDIALLVLDEAVRRRHRIDRILLELRRLGVEPAELVGELAGPPDRAVMGGHRIVRARARRRQVEFLDGRLDRAGDQHGRRPRLFREALDQVGGDRIPVLLLHRRAEIAHHAGDGAPAFRRIAGGQPVDVMAAAAYPGDEFLAGAFREVLPRLLGGRRKYRRQQGGGDERPHRGGRT